jgi:hypothetical protein
MRFDHGRLQVVGGGLRDGEGGGDPLILLRRLARFALLRRRLVAQAKEVEPEHARVEGAGDEARCARESDAALQPPEDIGAPVFQPRELLLGGIPDR